VDWKVFFAAPLVAAFLVAGAGEVSMPQDWGQASTGRSNKSYAIGLDPGMERNGRRSLSVRSLDDNDDTDYGSAMQVINAFGYGGRRVRFSGMLKTSGITGWAGVFLQSSTSPVVDTWGSLAPADLPRGSASAKGSSDWHPVGVVLEVPDRPGSLVMGLALVGNGQAWLSDLKFEEVGPDVPVTAQRIGLDLDRLAQRRRERRDAQRPEPKQVPYNLELQ
jgi:hypothetical protein